MAIWLSASSPRGGYNIDPKETYHDPDLVPPHNYFAFYFWLRHFYGLHAIIHAGKHGNLEWLPGKALALSEACFPETVLGPIPHLYPFIVNDPGEGCQAKRRTSAVIIDHLTPPLTRAESHGAGEELEALVDEFYTAQGVDPRRSDMLLEEIRFSSQSHRPWTRMPVSVPKMTTEPHCNSSIRISAILRNCRSATVCTSWDYLRKGATGQICL